MKDTRAFQLTLVTEPIEIGLNKEDSKWYPLATIYSDKNELFIYGTGTVKTGRWKKEIIDPLPVLTAEEIKKVYDKYGISVVKGLINGWSGTLFTDQSCGIYWHKCEVMVMAHFGKTYDDFTDKVQAIGDHFVNSLLDNGFRYDHNCIYHGDHLVGFKRNVKLHPLWYIDTCLKGMCAIPPSFDSIGFDELMVTLFQAKYYDDGDLWKDHLDKIVSVKDRITHLTSPEIAAEIESIFELQKVFDKR